MRAWRRTASPTRSISDNRTRADHCLTWIAIDRPRRGPCQPSRREVAPRSVSPVRCRSGLTKHRLGSWAAALHRACRFFTPKIKDTNFLRRCDLPLDFRAIEGILPRVRDAKTNAVVPAPDYRRYDTFFARKLFIFRFAGPSASVPLISSPRRARSVALRAERAGDSPLCERRACESPTPVPVASNGSWAPCRAAP